MKVLLLNPPNFSGQRLSRGLMGGYGLRVASSLVYPPTQLAQLAAVLENHNFPVEIRDAEARKDSVGDTLDHVGQSGAGLVAIPCSQDAFEDELSLGREIRERNGIPVCLLGPMAYNHQAPCFSSGAATFVVIGEPDLALADLARDVSAAHSAGTSLEITAPGIAYCQEGQLRTTPGENRVADLDALPFPARHLLDSSLYRYPGDDRRMTTIHSSRGCPIGCSFCAYATTEGQTIRERSPESVVREIEQAFHHHGITLVVFRDPIFTLNRRRVVEICSRLRELVLPLEWICETALRCVDRELLETMRSAGCTGLSFGVESAEDALQEKYAKNKIVSKAHVLDVVETCRRLGITTRAFFMMGFPEETEAMRKETVDFALLLDPDTVQFVPLTLYAGTPLYEELEGASARPTWKLDPAVQRSLKQAYRRFYSRPSRLLRELRSPGDLLRKAERYLSLS